MEQPDAAAMVHRALEVAARNQPSGSAVAASYQRARAEEDARRAALERRMRRLVDLQQRLRRALEVQKSKGIRP